MENWEDQGIVLSVRRHGENGAIVSLLTKEQGRHAGYVRGALSSKMRGSLELGNIVDAHWQARNCDDLGTLRMELINVPVSHFISEPLKLSALQSACALCDAALPEREGHPGLYHGLLALFEALDSDVWGAAYVMWEVAFLKELGFPMDFLQCAGGGSADNLAYLSPKTGRSVSLEAGEPYKDKLLPLPEFLRPSGGGGDNLDILTGLKMTSYFLEHWAFTHHSHGIPDARLLFEQRFAKNVESEEALKEE